MRPLFHLFFAAAMSSVYACGAADRSDDPSPPTPSSSSASPTEPAGSGEGSAAVTAPESACVGATRTICERACACTAGVGCVVSYGAATEEHDSLSACTKFYQFYVCGQPTYAKAYTDACRSAVDAAACVATTKGSALALPTACQQP